MNESVGESVGLMRAVLLSHTPQRVPMVQGLGKTNDDCWEMPLMQAITLEQQLREGFGDFIAESINRIYSGWIATQIPGMIPAPLLIRNVRA